MASRKSKPKTYQPKVTAAGASALASPAAETAAAMDSYQNIPARLGLGTNNQAGQGTYPLTRLSHNYPLLLAMYRSSWLVRRIVDAVAEDMLKDFPSVSSEMTPEKIDRFDKVVNKTGTLDGLRSALKWGRLFGGGVALICIKGHQNLAEPLNLDDIQPYSYRGLIALDRWSGVQPGAKLVTDLDDPKSFGLPESYTCSMDSGTIEVHHSRLLRFTGRELPNWERQTEQYWGLSEVEVIYDELQKRDYTDWNIVSLVTRAQIFFMNDPELASLMSGVGASNAAYMRYVTRIKALSDSMNNQGLGVLGKDGQVHQHTFSFAGLSDVVERQMLNLSAAAGIPFEVLFGRQSGLGSNGESGLQVYYDSIEQKRSRELGPQMEKLVPIICMSANGEIPDDLDYIWPAVRTMSNKDRAELGKSTTESILSAYDHDAITKLEMRRELKQASGDNGLFSNITDEAIAATPDKYASEVGGGELNLPEFTKEGSEENEDIDPTPSGESE